MRVSNVSQDANADQLDQVELERLTNLANDPRESVRRSVASNPRIPLELLKIFTKLGLVVPIFIFVNVSSPPDAVLELSTLLYYGRANSRS